MGNKKKSLFQGTTNKWLDGLVASWKYEDNLNDYNGIHNGIIIDGVETYQGGKVGQGFSCNTIRHISVNDHPDLSFTDGLTDLPFTFTTWLKTSSNFLKDYIFFSKRDATNWEYQLEMNMAGNITFKLFSENDNLEKIVIRYPFTWQASTWYFIGASYEGTGVKEGLHLLVNNDIATLREDVGTGNYVKMTATNAPVYIAALYSRTNQLFGVMDETKLYNKYMPISELQEMRDIESIGKKVF